MECLQIPESIQEIGPNFVCCKQLITITLAKANESFSLKGDALLDERRVSFAKRDLEFYIIVDPVEIIGGEVFSHCGRLHTVIGMFDEGSQWKRIDEFRFFAIVLTSLHIRDTVMFIREAEFVNCFRLSEIGHGSCPVHPLIGSWLRTPIGICADSSE
jgi:hypothetical protein